jgi:hypothetical protein
MLAIQSKHFYVRLGATYLMLTIASAFYRFSQRTLSAEAVAQRTIHPGDEININC